MPRTFKINDQIYDIPEEYTEQFLQKYPNSQEVQSYVVGKDTFDIPLNYTDQFKSKYPDANLLYPNTSYDQLKNIGNLTQRENYVETNAEQKPIIQPQKSPETQIPLRNEPEQKPEQTQGIQLDQELKPFEPYKTPQQMQVEENIAQIKQPQQFVDPIKQEFISTSSKDENDQRAISSLYDEIDKYYSDRGGLTPQKKLYMFNTELAKNPENVKGLANKYGLKINSDGSIGIFDDELKKYNDIFKRKYETVLDQEQIKNKDTYIKDVTERLYSGLNRVAGDVNATLGYAGLNLIPGYQEKFVEPAYKVAEEYKEKSSRGTESITKAVKEGNYKGAVGEAVLQFFENAPNLAMLAVPAAAGMETAGLYTMGLTTGSGQYYQLKDEDIPEYLKLLNAVTTGLAEMTGEAATTVPILKNSFSVLKKSGIEEGKKQLAQVYTSEMNRILTSLYGGINTVLFIPLLLRYFIN